MNCSTRSLDNNAPRVSATDNDDESALYQSIDRVTVFATKNKQFKLVFIYDENEQLKQIGIETVKYDEPSSTWKYDLDNFSLPITGWTDFYGKMNAALKELENEIKKNSKIKPSIMNQDQFQTLSYNMFYFGEKNRFVAKLLSINGKLYPGIQSYKYNEQLKRWKNDMKGFFLAPDDWAVFVTKLRDQVKAQMFRLDKKTTDESPSVTFDSAIRPAYSSSEPDEESPETPPPAKVLRLWYDSHSPSE